MTEHNNPAGAPVASAVDRDALREQLFKAAHPLTSKWGWFPAEKHAGEIADATLAVAQPVLERQAAELADVWASREAWALEADRLDVIATAACLVTHPRECGRDESDCTNDDSCPRAEERYATADDLIGVTALSEEVARLTRERDEAQQSLEAAHRELADYQQQYADLWRDATAERIQFDRVLTHLVPAARQVNGTISGLVLREQAGDLVKKLITDLESRPAIPADAVVLPDNWETQIRQALNARAYDISEAGPLPGTSSHDRDADRCADEIAGDVVVMINDWMSAPVSGSDTTEDGGDR